MAWSREANFKFVFRAYPCGSLVVWGIPGNYPLDAPLKIEDLKKAIEDRKLLRFSASSLEEGLPRFFSSLRKGILHWFEDPWVFFTCDEVLKDREFEGQKIVHIPKNSSPKEFRFVEKIEALEGSAILPDSTLMPKEKLLLHVCCGPDAAGVVEQLQSEFDLKCFWYDPNIQPKEEYDLRLAAFEKVMKIFKVPYEVGPYDVENFEKNISGLEWSPEQGAKCSVCYDMRLEKSAQFAQQNDFPNYATTLAISPHKVQKKLQSFGELHFKKYGVRYFHRNFMKNDGFVDSVEFTKEHDIYRQDYCGCLYSLHEGGPDAKSKAQNLGLLPQDR